ncbi:MAG: hypothetical protein OXC92_01775 [Flavobacteriaceae bacterium]|nr:hypothetical protein [Flavobacteriaceae bacterium]
MENRIHESTDHVFQTIADELGVFLQSYEFDDLDYISDGLVISRDEAFFNQPLFDDWNTIQSEAPL